MSVELDRLGAVRPLIAISLLLILAGCGDGSSETARSGVGRDPSVAGSADTSTGIHLRKNYAAPDVPPEMNISSFRLGLPVARQWGDRAPLVTEGPLHWSDLSGWLSPQRTRIGFNTPHPPVRLVVQGFTSLDSAGMPNESTAEEMVCSIDGAMRCQASAKESSVGVEVLIDQPLPRGEFYVVQGVWYAPDPADLQEWWASWVFKR